MARVRCQVDDAASGDADICNVCSVLLRSLSSLDGPLVRDYRGKAVSFKANSYHASISIYYIFHGQKKKKKSSRGAEDFITFF